MVSESIIQDDLPAQSVEDKFNKLVLEGLSVRERVCEGECVGVLERE